MSYYVVSLFSSIGYKLFSETSKQKCLPMLWLNNKVGNKHWGASGASYFSSLLSLFILVYVHAEVLVQGPWHLLDYICEVHEWQGSPQGYILPASGQHLLWKEEVPWLTTNMAVKLRVVWFWVMYPAFTLPPQMNVLSLLSRLITWFPRSSLSELCYLAYLVMMASANWQCF